MHISVYLLAPAIAWVTAHTLKYVIQSYRTRSLRVYQQFYQSGGMPSGHSAVTISLATIVGLYEGIDSALFAIAAVLALVVVYDSVTVRHSSGSQGEAIVSLIEKGKSDTPLPRVTRGHTPLEATIGAILGTLVSVVVFIAT